MAGEGNLLTRLAALIGGFDDASWEALGSKGLLRRARKDLEKGLALEVAGESAAGIEIKVPPFIVWIPSSGPAKATCTCRTPGICQHILAAGLYVQGLAAATPEVKPAATPASIREEVSLISPQRLREWAGTADYRAGVALLEKNSLPPTIEYGETVLIRLMPSSAEARFVPGAGLDGVIWPAAQGKRLVVAVMLALRRSLGLIVLEAGVQRALIDVSGTPRTPREIMSSAQSVLEDAVTVGLSHLSPTVAERLLTLAVSAQAANLPRVSLALRSISDEVHAILQREARADESRLLLSSACVYALMEAIKKGDDRLTSALVGVSRLQYVEVPEIELFGVGAYPWKTGSGYVGLTVLFWSNQNHEFLSWSETRPADQQFDPRQRFQADGPWDGAQSPRQAASSQLKLSNARRTVSGRISGSTRTKALVLAPTPLPALDFGDRLFASWGDLQKYVRRQQPLGLRDSNPLDMVVVLQPSGFGTRAFDSITQTFTWDVHDKADQVWTLTLPFRDWTKEAIKIMEELAPAEDSNWQFVVRMAVKSEGLVAEPVSLLRPEKHKAPVFCLSFDVLGQEAAAPHAADSQEPDDAESAPEEEEEFTDPVAPRGGYLGTVVGEMVRRLEAISETGCMRELTVHRDWFEKTRHSVHDSGLTSLAEAMEALAKPPKAAGRAVLQTRFLAYLHIQARGHTVG